MNPRTELEKRYPTADFSVYFRHLSACKTAKSVGTQEHHICPRKPFPEFSDAPENLITLSIKEHSEAHELLHAAVPELWAPSKWIASAAEGGKKTASRCCQSKTGFYSSATQKKAFAGRKKNEVAYHANQVKAARAGGKKCVENGHLARLRTSEHQVAANRRANHNRWHVRRSIISPCCILCAVLQ